MLDKILTEIGPIATFIGFAGIVSAFNLMKAIQWKRAELAGTYLRDFYSDPEILFACRALEWPGGRLVIPDCLHPLLLTSNKVINHDFDLLLKSMTAKIDINDYNQEPKMQIYRTAMDSFFTRLSIIASAIENKLFYASDIEEIGYWVIRIKSIGEFDEFINAYGYGRSTEVLRKEFRKTFEYYNKSIMIEPSAISS